MNGAVRSGEVRSAPFAVAWNELTNAFADLEWALDCHDREGASCAAFDWWRALARLREAA